MGKSKPFTEADIFRIQTVNKLQVHDPVIDQKLKKAFGISHLKTKKTYSNKPINTIEFVLIAMKLEYKKEYRFDSIRKYRFDFFITELNCGLEYEGIYSNVGEVNGHTGHKHFNKDVLKYNLATVNGFKILRYTADNYMNVATDLEKLLTNK